MFLLKSTLKNTLWDFYASDAKCEFINPRGKQSVEMVWKIAEEK